MASVITILFTSSLTIISSSIGVADTRAVESEYLIPPITVANDTLASLSCSVIPKCG